MSRDTRPPVIFLMGPTAAGKTDLAVALVERLGASIVSVDSALVYRGMDIGTAKPDAETLARAPHRLIDIRDPAESYSAAEFREDALRAIAAIRAEGRIPLLVGGTGLYFRALEHGLSPLPEADPALRRALEEEAARDGWARLHGRLAEVDPAAAARIHPNDPQRLSRALEVYTLTGRPLSELQGRPGEPLPWRMLKVVVAPSERERLRERIGERFRQMLAQGFVAEVEALYRRGDLHPGLPSIRCVGYRQAWAYLAGDWDYATMSERAVIATRQLAKRQLTWLRREADAEWFDSLAAELTPRVLKWLSANAIN